MVTSVQIGTVMAEKNACTCFRRQWHHHRLSNREAFVGVRDHGQCYHKLDGPKGKDLRSGQGKLGRNRVREITPTAASPSEF